MMPPGWAMFAKWYGAAASTMFFVADPVMNGTTEKTIPSLIRANVRIDNGEL